MASKARPKEKPNFWWSPKRRTRSPPVPRQALRRRALASRGTGPAERRPRCAWSSAADGSARAFGIGEIGIAGSAACAFPILIPFASSYSSSFSSSYSRLCWQGTKTKLSMGLWTSKVPLGDHILLGSLTHFSLSFAGGSIARKPTTRNYPQKSGAVSSQVACVKWSLALACLTPQRSAPTCKNDI